MKDMNVEISLSSRATCRKCRDCIKENDLRLKVYLGNSYGHSEYGYYCAVCGLPKLKEEVKNAYGNIKTGGDDIIRLERFIQKSKNGT